jgi:hypothetical protein
MNGYVVCARVLLETVAFVPHEDQPPYGTGRRQVDGDCYGRQRQELLAPVAIKGDASRDEERLVEGTRAGEYP